MSNISFSTSVDFVPLDSVPHCLINPLEQLCLDILCYFINSSCYGVSRKRNICCSYFFLTASSQKKSSQAKSNSSPIVKGFWVLAMRPTTKNHAFSAGTFVAVVTLNNCFCSSCSSLFFFVFFKKIPRVFLLMQNVWSLLDEVVLKVS